MIITKENINKTYHDYMEEYEFFHLQHNHQDKWHKFHKIYLFKNLKHYQNIMNQDKIKKSNLFQIFEV